VEPRIVPGEFSGGCDDENGQRFERSGGSVLGGTGTSMSSCAALICDESRRGGTTAPSVNSAILIRYFRLYCRNKLNVCTRGKRFNCPAVEYDFRRKITRMMIRASN
jgi:hypothetical protein